MRRSEKPQSVRSTRLIATIGPSCQTVDILRRMIRAGIDVFRLNMSHSDLEGHARDVALIRAAAQGSSHPVGIMCDLQGPKLRTGSNEGGKDVPLRKGELVQLLFPFVGGTRWSGPGRLFLDCAALATDLVVSDSILLDDGRMELRVEQKGRGGMRARVLRGGLLREHAGINLPGKVLSTMSPTPRDLLHASFALEQGAEFIALSFVQSAEDLKKLRTFLRRKVGRKELAAGRRMPLLVAKIEKPAALQHLDEIMAESDGVLVARGDLGVELSLEKVPLCQKKILRRARARGCFTITATQMLESMIRNPSPTRAEVSDVANAILDGSDALLLTAETAIGRYPVESVQVLARVAEETDQGEGFGVSGGTAFAHATEAMARAAVELAHQSCARWIVVFTQSGRTAWSLARYRSDAPVLALTPREETRQRLSLCRSTRSLILPQARSVDEMMRRGLELLRRERLLKTGDSVVLLAGTSELPQAENLLRLVCV